MVSDQQPNMKILCHGNEFSKRTHLKTNLDVNSFKFYKNNLILYKLSVVLHRLLMFIYKSCSTYVQISCMSDKIYLRWCMYQANCIWQKHMTYNHSMHLQYTFYYINEIKTNLAVKLKFNFVICNRYNQKASFKTVIFYIWWYAFNTMLVSVDLRE